MLHFVQIVTQNILIEFMSGKLHYYSLSFDCGKSINNGGTKKSKSSVVSNQLRKEVYIIWRS